MALLLDYSGITYASFFATPEQSVEENFLRHMVLNSIRMYVEKYSKEYGEVIIASDGENPWRRNYFSEYKYARKKNRENSDIDWNKFFTTLRVITEEIKIHFPYYFLKIENVEADDIIAFYVEKSQEFGINEKNMIVSADHDYIQLQKYKNVKQFSPTLKKIVSVDNPEKYAFEQILRGCNSDGVPNILSDDDCFVVENKRQKPLSSKRVDELWEIYKKSGFEGIKKILSEKEFRNYMRNELMINLSKIPEDIKLKIGASFLLAKEQMQKRDNSKILNYLVEKRCKQLVSSVEEFFPNRKGIVL